ncbi:hypothetical protein AB0L99_20320 [Streptomyces sp. NPDC051954]|uniref:hypothetical protein n=1 Tax=unclassified Streptomyces TaxID=2593676 RepID=UPI00342500FD
MIRGRRARAEAGRGGGTDGGTLGRRGVLGGLAALPVLCGIGSAGSAPAAAAARPDNLPKAVDDLVRGAERRYHAPLLTTGTRLLLPTGIKAVPVQDYYHRPHLASARSTWPHMTATDGTPVDASVLPERGAPTRIAILSGFTEGWYELSHASGRTDRVTWDARKLPFVWFYGEFGATNEAPYHKRFFTLALQPLSRNPYSRNPYSRNVQIR